MKNLANWYHSTSIKLQDYELDFHKLRTVYSKGSNILTFCVLKNTDFYQNLSTQKFLTLSSNEKDRNSDFWFSREQKESVFVAPDCTWLSLTAVLALSTWIFSFPIDYKLNSCTEEKTAFGTKSWKCTYRLQFEAYTVWLLFSTFFAMWKEFLVSPKRFYWKY